MPMAGERKKLVDQGLLPAELRRLALHLPARRCVPSSWNSSVLRAPSTSTGMAPHLHHGLVAPQRQEHAGSQLVFRQREQEFFGLVTGAHEDVHLWRDAQVKGLWSVVPASVGGRFVK